MELFKRYHSITNQTVYTLPTGEKVYPAVVDVKKGMQGGGDISYVETDNNVGFIIVSLVEGESKFKIPSTAKVTCNIKRPDGHFLEIDCTKMDESTVQIALGSAGTKVEGVHSFDIKIQYSDDIVIGTPIMSYMVQSGLTLDGAIEEDERLPMLTALIEEVKTIHENTTELAEEVSELSENIGAIVEGAGARLDEEIAEFRSQSEELIASANSAVEEVNNSLEQITTSIEEVNQGIDEVNDAISEVNTALEEVNSNMDRIDSVIIEANQAIENMESTQNTSKELNEQSEMLISEMQGLIADGLDIEEIVDARDGEESLSVRLNRDLQGVYEYVDNKQVDLSSVESKIAENTNKLNLHERLIDNNLNSIGSLTTRITNNTKTLTNHSTEISNTKQEITTKVNALKTEIGEDIASINDDVARIQEELQKSENIKYSTENGVKEFSCKDGYIDNIAMEGKTLVNLYKKNMEYVMEQGGTSTGGFNTGDNYEHLIVHNFTGLETFVYSEPIPHIQQGKEYTLIVDVEGLTIEDGRDGSFEIFHEGDVIYGGRSEELVKVKFTSNHNSPRIRFDANNLAWVKFKDIIILEGDHTDKPISYFEGLKSVGQGDKIEVLSYNGKNFDYGSLSFTNGIKLPTSGVHTDNNDWKYSNYIKVNPNTDYLLKYVSVNVNFYDINKNIIPSDYQEFLVENVGDTSIGHIYIKTPSNCEYIIIHRRHINTTPIEMYTISLYDKKQILTTLRSLPNGVRDTIEKRGNKYVKVQRCGEYVYKGEVFNYYASNDAIHHVQIKLNNIKTYADTNISNVISNLIPHQSSSNDVNFRVFIKESSINIVFPISSYTDENSIKNYLKANNFTVVYELETPQIIELPNFNPQTFEGDTTLIINSGVVQSECEFEVTNSRGSEIDVLKNNASSIANSISNMDNSINRIDNSISRIDNSISSIQKIHYSTVTPSSAEGKDGDLWVIYK